MGTTNAQVTAPATRLTPVAPSRKGSGGNTARNRTVGAAKAKAEFLAIAERVHSSEKAVTITKRGVPFVRLAPLEEQAPAKSIIGCMKGTATIVGDIVGPEPDVWDALS